MLLNRRPNNFIKPLGDKKLITAFKLAAVFISCCVVSKNKVDCKLFLKWVLMFLNNWLQPHSKFKKILR
jgi:hypothetical protein